MVRNWNQFYFFPRKGRVSANCFSKWRTNTLKSLNQTWSQCLLAPGTWVMLLTSCTFEQVWIHDWQCDSAVNTPCSSAGNAGPPHNISSWFQCKGQGKTRDDTADYIPHDIYVIGTQEDPLSERELADTVKGVLRNLTSISFKQVWNCDACHDVMLNPGLTLHWRISCPGGNSHSVEHSDHRPCQAGAWEPDLSCSFWQCEDGNRQHSRYKCTLSYFCSKLGRNKHYYITTH